jgi:hypothetical protein
MRLTAQPPDRPGLRTWPLPALLAWGAAWLVQRTAVDFGLPGAAAGLGACALGFALALRQTTRWRQFMVAAGFPLSALLSGLSGPAAAGSAWLWLLPIALLLLLYPVRAWSDAPLFPTPAQALAELPQHAPLAAGASVLDAGCGLGHGLQDLRRAFPDARLHGVEWSTPIAWGARLRCPWAHIRRGDMWGPSWAGHQLVYLFQRPGSMARAWAKACAEMPPGSWLVSLEFPIEGVPPHARLANTAGKPVWLYRVPGAN